MPNLEKCGFARRAAGLALVAALALLGGQPARAEVIKAADMVRGIHMTAEECAVIPQAVWVIVSGRQFCIRYYLSTAGGQGPRPLVFLEGDAFGRLNLRTGEFAGAGEAKDTDTDRLANIADVLSRQARGPGIYLARVGLDGSSGHHRIRRTVLELDVIDAALEVIKRRHTFQGFHFVGQSGGAALIGGLLAKRSDIGCAVLGAGPLALQAPLRRASDPAEQYFSAADSAAIIATRPQTRIFLVTDPADKKVSFDAQAAFVDALRLVDGKAEQIMVEAFDENRHGVLSYSRTTVDGCMRGAKTADIIERVRRQVEFQRTKKAANDNAPKAPETPKPPEAHKLPEAQKSPEAQKAPEKQAS